MNKIVIHPTSGLANRLRVIFSCLTPSASLEVVWRPSKACPGHFLDHFEPIEGVKFVSQSNQQVHYCGCQPQGVPNYSQLRPNSDVRARVQENLIRLTDLFTAVHVRRTDAIELAKKNKRFTANQAFYQFIDKTSGPLFVACDTAKTLEAFRQRYGERIKVSGNFTTPNRLRQTTLRQAVVDIYTCVKAERFMGSGYSSFSGLILALRS